MQRRIPATYYRGGTSRAVVFHRKDLPPLGAAGTQSAWDALICAAMGSPDPSGRQLDGMGGGISSLSKIAIVSPSVRSDADLDYTFGQVGIDTASVSYRGNCGNISSAIGPFAVEEGLIPVADGMAAIRIFNTNTGKMLVAEFEIVDGVPRLDGPFEIDGVAGTAAPIKLSFLDPWGAVSGAMFPTGEPLTELKIDPDRAVSATLIDVANPTVIVAAETLVGPSDNFAPADFSRDEIVARAECIRIAAAIAMGLAADENQARQDIPNLPLVAAVLAPRNFTARSGRQIGAERVDIITHMYSAGLPHKASPVTGAMALAAACQVPGTLAHSLARAGRTGDDVRIGHPSGVLDVAARCVDSQGIWTAHSTGVYRTARRLFEGNVLVP